MAVPVVLTIAGSDSCGGAGIQADLKTMSAHGVFGATALTAVTAQNTMGVDASFLLSPELVAAQIEAVVEDLAPAAAKTGMLGSAETVAVVADRVERLKIPNLVVDPVMVATSGASLIEDDAVRAVADLLIPLAEVVTPNVPEAEVLSGLKIESVDDMESAARAVHGLGASFVLVKGGHMTESADDVLFDGNEFIHLTGERIPGGRIHGTGCTLSAAIASGLALGWGVRESAARAKAYVTGGIASCLDLGKGSSLVNHFTPVDGDA